VPTGCSAGVQRVDRVGDGFRDHRARGLLRPGPRRDDRARLPVGKPQLPPAGRSPPRRDLSISADGARIAIPGGAAVVVYDVDSKRWLARVPTPSGAAGAAGAAGKMSADGKHIRWSSPGGGCSMTEIETGALHDKCK
jgi:hypothetical protein